MFENNGVVLRHSLSVDAVPNPKRSTPMNANSYQPDEESVEISTEEAVEEAEIAEKEEAGEEEAAEAEEDTDAAEETEAEEDDAE